MLNLPSAPDGYKYATDGAGKATTVLTKDLNAAANSVSTLALAATTAATAAGASALEGLEGLGSKFPSFKLPDLPKLPTIEGPSFADTLASVKSGSIFSDIGAKLGDIGDVASSLPASVSGGLTELKDQIAAKLSAAQATLGKDMAVAQAAQDLKVKESLAATGKPPTEAELKAVSGKLSLFEDAPKLLAEKAKALSAMVASAGAAFGAAVTDVAGQVNPNNLLGAAQSAGAKVTEFANTIPAETIPDPENPSGPAIPNPSYTAFAAANPDKMSALSSLTSSVGSFTTGLDSGFSALTAAASAAGAAAMSNLKASALVGQLSQPATGIMATVKSQAIDTSKIDTANISKTMAQAAASNPAVAPKDEKAGASEVKDETAKVEPAARENAVDRVYKSEVFSYFDDYVRPLKDKVPELLAALKATDLFKQGKLMQTQWLALKEAKPDKSQYTTEESEFATKYAELRDVYHKMPEYTAYKEGLDAANAESNNYNNYVLKAFEKELSRNSVPAEVRSRLSLESAYQSVKKNSLN